MLKLPITKKSYFGFQVSASSFTIKARRIVRLAAMSLTTTILLISHSAQALQNTMVSHPVFIALNVFPQIGIILFTAFGIIGTVLGYIRMRLYQYQGKEINKFAAIAPGLMGPVASLLMFLMAWNFGHIGLISPFVVTLFWQVVAVLNIAIFLSALLFTLALNRSNKRN